jgi:hypothetical protein
VANAFGVSLPIRALFEAPTVEALARRIDEARETQSNEPTFEIARLEGDGTKPVSLAQDQVLRIERELPGLPQFNLPFAYRLQGPLNVLALERSLAEVVRRHESLRTQFAWVDQRPVALILPPGNIESSLVVEDIAASMITKNDRTKVLLMKKAESQAEQEAWTSFDVARAPLFRMRLLRLGVNDHVLVMVLHHIIVDGWSIGIFVEEISKLYSAFAADRRTLLPEPTLQFSDLAQWQRRWCTTDSAARQLAYWKEKLCNASPVFPSAGDRRGARLSSRVAHEPVHLPKDFVARLSALSRSQGATLFMTLLAGFKAMLLTRTGRNDICVATAMANRSQQGTDRVVGPLENTAIIRTRMDLDLSFEEALGRVRDSVLEAHSREQLPFDILAARLKEEGGPDPVSLTQVYFILQDPFRRPLQLPDVAVRPFGDIHREGQPVLPIDHTWLTLMLKERPSGVTGSCTYKYELFEHDAVRYWIVDYMTVLTNAVANHRTPLGRLVDRLEDQV